MSQLPMDEFGNTILPDGTVQSPSGAIVPGYRTPAPGTGAMVVNPLAPLAPITLVLALLIGAYFLFRK